MTNQKLLAQKTKDLHKKLCDVTKDPSTKMELKQKIANLEKQLGDAEKQIGRSCLCTSCKHVGEKVVLTIR